MSLFDRNDEMEEMPRRLLHWLGQLSKYGVQSCFSGSHEWIPRADIHETETAYHVFVDLAGVEPAQIELSIEENGLCLKGDRKRLQVSGCARIHQMEIDSGRFQRSFQFLLPIDAGAAQSFYRNGFLEIVLPKLPEPVSVRVPLRQE
jgi:HSP20 family protein